MRIAKLKEELGRIETQRDVRRKWLRSELPPISLGLKCYGDARWRF